MVSAITRTTAQCSGAAARLLNPSRCLFNHTQVEVEGVGTVSVLNENNYSMQQGGISMAHRAQRADAKPVKRNKLQIAGRDYSHMQHCQVGGRAGG